MFTFFILDRRALEEELRVETEKHRHAREELKSAKANLQYAKTQYTHEARKKEQELSVLKEKLQKAVDRTASTSLPGGITILNPVPRSLYGKQQTNEAEQLLKSVIEQQQAKEVEIVEENEQLRMTLYTVHVELEGLIKKHSTLSNPATVSVRVEGQWPTRDCSYRIKRCAADSGLDMDGSHRRRMVYRLKWSETRSRLRFAIC